MNKKIIAIATLIALLSIGIVAAYGFGGQSSNAPNKDMENMMETGTYTDLVNYRTTSGDDVMPWVQSDETFKTMQEQHEAREQYAEENGLEMGSHMMGRGFRQGDEDQQKGSGFGRSRGFGGQRGTGCPMFDGDEN